MLYAKVARYEYTPYSAAFIRSLYLSERRYRPRYAVDLLKG